MLDLNLRRGNSKVFFGDPTWADASGLPMTTTQVAAELSGKRVLVLVHGYNVDDPFDAYSRVAMNIDDLYDEMIGVRVPLSRIGAAFWTARLRAPKAGRLLSEALRSVSLHSAQLDIEAHSLGCMVTLEALNAGLRTHHVILTAPAVDNESIQLGEKYGRATCMTRWLMIAHSEEDPVLRTAYTFGSWDRALGLTGPEDPKKCGPNVKAVDLSEYITSHSGYKSCPPFYAMWRNLLNNGKEQS